MPFLCWRYLFSRFVSKQVSSAQVSLTSVFGMGTGGPSLQSTPTYFLVNKKVSKENFHGRPPYGSVSCFLCCPTLRSTKKGLALVLKRLNYAGSEFFEIVLCYPFRKVPQIIFVSLCCLLFILGYFVQFSRCVSSFFRNQIQTLNLLECLHPISHYLTGTRPRRDAGSPAHKRFGEAKTLPQGQFICPEDVLSPLGLPI